ncbi:DUF6765 family protein [Roseococcus sp. YIM B11640]|uniref:eCIS core domain-containing protein n=1 Tax=Roseococcus sp. YIM B11640 TaxID=3133973 RepID=UPI003C7B5A48
MQHPLPGRGGRPLPDTLRGQLERAFGADLSGIRLHGCAGARRVTESLGARGVAVDGAILLAPGATAGVVAHEVAHILQSRLPGDAPDAARAEAEARRLGPRALRGLPCRISAPVDAREPMCWEEAGHYYTIYFTALACRLPDREAMQIAFWAQFPDEVSELDAVKAGFDIPAAAVGRAAAFVTEDTGIKWAFEDFVSGLNNSIMSSFGMGGYGRMPPSARKPYKNLQVNLDVQKGLHCLTGANWNIETKRRTDISLAASLADGAYEFGMSLHSFGDSFAHRNHDTGCMYPPFLGHGPETKVVQIAGDELSRKAGLVHPDSLGPHRQSEFFEYIERLHGIISTRYSLLSPVKNAQQTAWILAPIIADKPDPKQQIGLIRKAVVDELRLPAMHEYAPEKYEDLPLSEFSSHDAPYYASYWHVRRGLELARAWAEG